MTFSTGICTPGSQKTHVAGVQKFTLIVVCCVKGALRQKCAFISSLNKTATLGNAVNAVKKHVPLFSSSLV